MKKIMILAVIVLVSACQGYVQKPKNPEFWQRTDATDSIYFRGPKAQHTLNKDVAACVVEIRELQRLGSLREATPPNTQMSRSDGAPKGGRVAGFDTPTYDGSEFASYFPYADFEGCMDNKGWQRVAYVPADVEAEAQRTFIEAIFTPQEKQNYYRAQYPDLYTSDSGPVNYDELNN